VLLSIVLIIAPADDVHALAVQRRIAEITAGSGRAVIVDLATYPLGGDLSVWIDSDRAESSLGCVAPLPLTYGTDVEARLARHDMAVRLDPSEIRAVWWRRARMPLPHAFADSTLRDFAQANTHAHLWSFFLSLPSSVRFINPIAAEARAAYKPVQLRLARASGLAIPRTLVTNNPDHATAFVRAQHDHSRACIVKQLRTVRAAGYLTQEVKPGDLERFEQFRDAPVILQERLTGLDIRVVVVGDEVFAAAETASAPTSIPDIRATLDTSCSRVSIPDEVRHRLMRLHADLGLYFGAYDFIRTDDGTWYFLEVNATGQWLYLETAASLPIAEAFARLLWHGASPDSGLRLAPYSDADLAALIGPFHDGVLERARASQPRRVHDLDA
jgi:glutathione synthase/RimK-type ligase-like ATP-grasp enzyme